MNREDCDGICRLLENGFSIQDALILMKEESNQGILSEIQENLALGRPVAQFFPPFLPSCYRIYFESFIRCMPFQESLSTSISVAKNEEKSRKQIVDGMLYPTLLLGGMIIGVYLFNELILPNMIRLMGSFQLDDEKYILIQKAIRMGTKGILFLIFLSCIMLVILFHKNNIVRTYIYISSSFPDSLLVQYVSAQFARFFLECQKRNISTKQCFTILMEVNEKPCVQYVASVLHKDLMSGDNLLQAIKNAKVENTLFRFFKLAYHSSDCEEMLQGYLEMVEMRKEKMIRTYAKIVQLFSYSICGLVIIFVYQILMMPMQMLQNLS